MIDWTDPSARARYLASVGPVEYDKAFARHRRSLIVEVVNGHAIRTETTRFGRLLAVGGTGNAYKDIEDARRFALSLPMGAETQVGA